MSLPERALAILLTCSVGALALAVPAGCGRSRSEKIMAFFFDGYSTGQDSLVLASVVDSAEVVRAQRRAEKMAKADSTRATVEMHVHPPYADGDCTSCHNMPGGGNAKVGQSSMPSLGSGRAEGPGYLIMPLEELCVECHDDKTEEYADESDMYIHAPVASGECTLCHHHHRSRFQNILLSDTIRVLCFQCHDESIGGGEDDHPELEESDDCTDCHNPHLSTEELFLY